MKAKPKTQEETGFTLEGALRSIVLQSPIDVDRWKPAIEHGADDDEIKSTLTFALGRTGSRVSSKSGICQLQTKPKLLFWFGSYGSGTATLAGDKLVERIREVLNIPPAAEDTATSDGQKELEEFLVGLSYAELQEQLNHYREGTTADDEARYELVANEMTRYELVEFVEANPGKFDRTHLAESYDLEDDIERVIRRGRIVERDGKIWPAVNGDIVLEVTLVPGQELAVGDEVMIEAPSANQSDESPTEDSPTDWKAYGIQLHIIPLALDALEECSNGTQYWLADKLGVNVVVAARLTTWMERMGWIKLSYARSVANADIEVLSRLVTEGPGFVISESEKAEESTAVANAPAEPEQLSFSFDYSELDEDTADLVRKCTGEIRERLGSIKKQSFEIADLLLTVKMNLETGQWSRWVQAETGLSVDTADRLVRSARFLEENPQIAESADRFDKSALYLLAAPSTPEAAIAEASERAQAGETITHERAKEIVQTHKPMVTRERITHTETTRTVTEVETSEDEPAMEIRLTQGQVALVSEQDFAELSRFKWMASLKRDQWYAVRSVGPRDDRHTLAMARVILGAGEDELVDHRNGNTLDNRRSNLRLSTAIENSQNRHAVWSSSGYKGVFYINREPPLEKPWRAEITVERQPKYLGYFSTPDEAARAYDEAARQYFGEFARTNFPLPPGDASPVAESHEVGSEQPSAPETDLVATGRTHADLLSLLKATAAGMHQAKLLEMGFTIGMIDGAVNHRLIERSVDGRCEYNWQRTDIVEALRGGPLSLGELEELGCQRVAVVSAESNGLIRLAKGGGYEIVEQEGPAPDQAPSSEAGTAVGKTTTTTPAEKLQPRIEEMLKGRQLAVTYTWIPELPGKVSVGVCVGPDRTATSYETIEAGKVRGFPERVMELIAEQLKGSKKSPLIKPALKAEQQKREAAKAKKRPAAKSVKASKATKKPASAKKPAAKKAGKSKAKKR